MSVQQSTDSGGAKNQRALQLGFATTSPQTSRFLRFSPLREEFICGAKKCPNNLRHLLTPEAVECS